jgi:hypothetical protein
MTPALTPFYRNVGDSLLLTNKQIIYTYFGR